jgi:hypothetical protein
MVQPAVDCSLAIVYSSSDLHGIEYSVHIKYQYKSQVQRSGTFTSSTFILDGLESGRREARDSGYTRTCAECILRPGRRSNILGSVTQPARCADAKANDIESFPP